MVGPAFIQAMFFGQYTPSSITNVCVLFDCCVAIASQNFCDSELLPSSCANLITCNYDSCILHCFLPFASRMHLACSPSLHTQRPQQLLIAIAVVVVLSDLLFLLGFLSSNVLWKPFGIRALAPHKNTRVVVQILSSKKALH